MSDTKKSWGRACEARLGCRASLHTIDCPHLHGPDRDETKAALPADLQELDDLLDCVARHPSSRRHFSGTEERSNR